MMTKKIQTKEEAKKKLLEYYKEHEGESIYPDEAAHELGLDLKVAMEAVEELIKEGKLEEGDVRENEL